MAVPNSLNCAIRFSKWYQRRKMTSSPTTISDLKEEINNLKEDITRLKEKNVVIEVRLDAIQTLQNLNDKASESSSSMEGENDNSLKAFTSQKFYTRITLLIDYNYKKEFIALIDSAANLNYIQGRWSDNSETIRTLLQNLRCKSLTSFRYYKDVFLCRVMELPEVRRSLRGDDHSINYDNYTYGKLISACLQEGLSLCNEIKLNQQIKRHRLMYESPYYPGPPGSALHIGEPSNKKDFYDSLNKISEKYARKPVQRMFYYPRPTPQDVLLEEHEHIITNSYNGKEIYEWNIDGYTDRQIFTTVHRMLMYSTICKTNKNSDNTIADMITAGFTGQLKDNSETIRTLLQNLRCKSLTSFRYYKDVFLCRVMELPECNSTHWKSKFIDGLPTLFAERVRRSLRGDDHSINYDNYTYGKLISACVQEGLSLCNEIKLNQQIKRHRLTERKQLGEFCEQFAFDIPKQKSKDLDSSSHKKKKSSKKDYEKWKKKKMEKKLRRAKEGRGDSSKRKKKYRQNFNKSDTCHKYGRYGHYAKDCRVKEKIKNLDIDDNLKDSLYKIMLNLTLNQAQHIAAGNILQQVRILKLFSKKNI
ncbi:hypothetical protein H5410_062542 [Solanum commersonii]|uniref:DUF7746 domain-containing protein n=1 Tax=Solanum commersonii TaxID=4109 RepID=A0A9J5WCM6_SOLCO|nr:hypothetical protein H5410_062542 [Solanum commersonii]